MKACCRASPCAVHCRSTRSPGCRGWRRAASSAGLSFPDIHRPPADVAEDGDQRAVRSIPKDETPSRLPRRRVHSLARRTGAAEAHGSRICPSSARIRPSSCRSLTTRSTIRPMAPPSPRRTTGRRSRDPSLPRLHARQAATRANFRAGHERQGARLGRRQFPQDPRPLLRHDLGNRTRSSAASGKRSRRRSAGTTRSSS